MWYKHLQSLGVKFCFMEMSLYGLSFLRFLCFCPCVVISEVLQSWSSKWVPVILEYASSLSRRKSTMVADIRTCVPFKGCLPYLSPG